MAGEDGIELVHEALLEQWPRLRDWLEEDAQSRRMRAQVASAAAAWEAAGRSRDELLRGARLAAVAEWADSSDQGLSPSETGFVDASRTEHARQTRRLRIGLAGALLLLLVAVLAGLVALASRASANRQATDAIAQRLGAQALSERRLDRALLLARAGVALDDTEATRSDLLATLLRSPAALRVMHPGGSRVLDDALSPDGRVLAVRGDDGSVSFFDAGTGVAAAQPWHGTANVRNVGSIVLPVRDLAFSPDGRTLAVGDNDGRAPTLALLDLATRHAAGRADETRRRDSRRGLRARRPHDRDGRDHHRPPAESSGRARPAAGSGRCRAPPVGADCSRPTGGLRVRRSEPPRHKWRQPHTAARRANVPPGALVRGRWIADNRCGRRHGRVRP